MPLLPGPATLYCPGKVQGLLSQVLQSVKGGAGCPTLMTLELALHPSQVMKGFFFV